MEARPVPHYEVEALTLDCLQTRPLRSFFIKSRPLTGHCLSWSCDAELAVATEDVIYIYLPAYPKATGPDEAEDDDIQPQFSLALRASGLIRPDPLINAQICAQAGVKLPASRVGEENWFAGVGNGLVTGSGATVSHIIRVEWSPNGLGCNLRPVLTALSTNGGLYVLGEHIDRQSTVITGMRTRSFKAWRTLWGLGALLPLPDSTVEGGYRNMTDRIQAFSWAKEIAGGRGLLAYTNDAEEIVIMSVHIFTLSKSTDVASVGDFKWQIQEVARFDGRGVHTKADATDITDPDFVPHGSAFSLSWSPWLIEGSGRRSATLSYLSKNHVGFRKVTLLGDWEDGGLPKVEVAETDTTSICTFLSPDAFVEWEDSIRTEEGIRIARGIVATPFDVKPFQISLSDDPGGAKMPHHTWECSTTYSKDDETTSTNPITSLTIHPPDTPMTASVPQYSLVRLSATAKNEDWYQSNLPEGGSTLPQWATKIRRLTTQLVSRMAALEGLDSDSDDSDDEMMVEDDGSKLQVHPYRFRIWGMAASPGGGATAALISRYSTQHPQRRGVCKLVFGWKEQKSGNQAEPQTSSRALTTEGRLWEWMYGGGPEVPGTATNKTSGHATDSLLREQFRAVVPQQRCVFCDASLHDNGHEARCENGHEFARCAATGLAILAPDISRICAVCELRCLKVSELLRIANQYHGPGATVGSSGESLRSRQRFWETSICIRHTYFMTETQVYRNLERLPLMPPKRAVVAAKSESACFEESLASKPFLFIVGEEKREYHVHKELIAQLSPALNALVNGNMREAQEGRVEWSDLDIDTFVRFAKYAYSRDYAEAEPEYLPADADRALDSRGMAALAQTLDSMKQEVPTEDNEQDSVGDDNDSEDGSGVSGDDDDVEGLESDDGDPDGEDGESELSDATSTLTNGAWEYMDGLAPSYDVPYDQMGIPDALPYSVEMYLRVFKAQVSKFQDAQAEAAQAAHAAQEAQQAYHYRDPRKRRRVDVVDYHHCPAFQHDQQTTLKYAAISRFRKLPVPKPPVPHGAGGGGGGGGGGGQHWFPVINSSQHESFEPVFLSHARLYVLADKYGITPLKCLTLYRLHLTLRHYNVYEERVSDLTALVEEIYQNTVEGDPARLVVATYLACVVEHIRGTAEFKAVLRVGDFADDLVQQMALRLE